MNNNLNRYLGRIVRLNKLAYQEIKERALRKGVALENSFLVASVNRKLKKIICYGANFRIVVSFSDVILV